MYFRADGVGLPADIRANKHGGEDGREKECAKQPCIFGIRQNISPPGPSAPGPPGHLYRFPGMPAPHVVR